MLQSHSKERNEFSPIKNFALREIHQKKQFEWGFGRNTNGELSFGVTRNALVPAFALGLTEISTK